MVPAHPVSHHAASARGVDRLPGARAVTRGFLYGLFFWALILFSVAVLPGLAARSLGPRWERPAVSFSAEPTVQPYVDAGVALWRGASALQLVAGGTDIVVRSGPLVPPVHYAGQPAQANLSLAGNAIAHCEVRVEPGAFAQLSEAGRRNVVAHELGHCLGLDHSDQPSIMKNPLLYGFSADDAAGLTALYGPAPASIRAAASSSPTAPAASEVVQPPAPRSAAPQDAPATAVAPTVAATPTATPSQPEPPAREPAHMATYAGSLAPGWNQVVWAGPPSSPDRCGCGVVYRDETASWSAPRLGFAGPNTLERLDPGVAYWMWAG